MEILRLLYHSVCVEIRIDWHVENLSYQYGHRWSEAFGVWWRRRIDGGSVISHGETAEALGAYIIVASHAGKADGLRPVTHY
eukprot:6266000-Ditylum_brightwellii.AAC.1